MTGPSFDRADLLELMGAVRDETVTPQQAEQLESILRHDAAARRLYIRFMTMHGLFEQAAVALHGSASREALPKSATIRPAPSRWLRRLWPLAAAAAVVLASLATWWMISPRTPGDHDGQKFAQGPGEGKRGPGFPGGFGGGEPIVWQVTPTGDARFVRISPTSLRLERGELRVRALKADEQPPDGQRTLAAMSVETPAGDVTVEGSDVLIGAHAPAHTQEQGDAKMKLLTRVLILAGMATLTNQHGSVTGEAGNLLAAQPNQAPAKQMVEANTGFAIDLYRQLAKQEEGKNLFFSPYSISIALAMTAEGARGATADEMGKVLHFPEAARRVGADAQVLPWQTALIHTGIAQLSRGLMAKAKQEKEPFELRIANALWGEKTYPFRKQFLDAVNDSYGTGAAFPSDFVSNFEAERVRINGWVADQTNKRIENLLPPGSLDGLTRLVLTNAIYFKGDWVQKFDKRAIRPEVFHTLAGAKVKTPMMSGEFNDARFAFIGAGDAGASLRAGKGEHFRLVELPYKGGLSMVLIAPDDVRGLPRLEARLSSEKLAQWLGQLRKYDKIEVSMPRFKFSTEYKLPDALKQLGMVHAFVPAGTSGGADFSGMSQSQRPELHIGGVYHKAFVAVNEEGTEAAAATGVIAMKGGFTPPPRFAGDRPFLFLIRDPQSQAVLFLGRVADAAGIANNDLSEAQERGIKLARTAPTKHPFYQRLKSAAGVAVLSTYRDPSGLMELKADDSGRMLLECRIALALRGELKTQARHWLAIDSKAAQSDAGQEFVNFFSMNYTKFPVLAIYQRQGGQWVVTDMLEADDEALLLAAHAFSIPLNKLTGAARNVSGAGR